MLAALAATLLLFAAPHDTALRREMARTAAASGAAAIDRAARPRRAR